MGFFKIDIFTTCKFEASDSSKSDSYAYFQDNHMSQAVVTTHAFVCYSKLGFQ